MTWLTESIVKDAALARLRELGYAVSYAADIAVHELAAERNDSAFRDVVLESRPRTALARLCSLSTSGPRGRSPRWR